MSVLGFRGLKKQRDFLETVYELFVSVFGFTGFCGWLLNDVPFRLPLCKGSIKELWGFGHS